SAPTDSVPRQAQQAAGAEGDAYRYGWRYVPRKGPDGLMDLEQVPLTLEDVLHPEEGDFIVNTHGHQVDCTYVEHVCRLVTQGQQGGEIVRDVRIDFGIEGVKPLGPDVALFRGLTRPFSLVEGTLHIKTYGAAPVLVVEATSPSNRI